MLTDTSFTTSDYWRAIVLYGLNTATYKIALGTCLAGFAEQGQTRVSMTELAESFLDVYLERLEGGKPQLGYPDRLTVMERIVAPYRAGTLTRSQAVERVAQEAFGDVVPRFHTVFGTILPIRFYEQAADGLVLTDSLHHAFEGGSELLLGELSSRWDLLEAAFELKRGTGSIANDVRSFYLARGYARTDITGLRTSLNGYQNGVCFYCGELMDLEDVHVDHVIPRQLLCHDEVWNLALAHPFCNEQKSDALPDPPFIEKLIERNEFLIQSNHPLKRKLMEQLGTTPKARGDFVRKVYEDARLVIRYSWSGIRGYHPGSDPFYRNFVRSITK